jgi:16S rRNA (uracil1498-N3)-methyltransferase
MHRFFAPNTAGNASEITLADDEAHHAVQVLRVRKGERVSVLNGRGDEFLCDALEVAKKTVQLRVVEVESSPAPISAITLIQAIPKGKIIESIIQKATELGVSRVVPVLSERVVTHLDDDSAEEKREKWQRVAIEACKQCGQRWMPKVEAPVTTKEFLQRSEKFEFAVVGCLEKDSRHLKQFFGKFVSAPKTVAVWVGPEGDFSPAEYAVIKESGACPITLGPLVLRSETAAVYALSIVSHELQAIKS